MKRVHQVRKRITEVRILGITSIPVEYVVTEDDPENLITEDGFPISGYFSINEWKIYINTDVLEYQARTIVHEALHCYWRHMFEPRTAVTEEQATRCIETAIADLCANNWELMKKLRAESKTAGT